MNEGFIYWISGNTNSGKTTLGRMIAQSDRGIIHIDGDEVRKSEGITSMSIKSRTLVNRIVAEQARGYVYDGFSVVVSVIAPTKKIRDMIRLIIPQVRFIFLPGGSGNMRKSPYEVPTPQEWWKGATEE